MLRVHEGPSLLAWIKDGPSLAAHRARFGELPTWPRAQLLRMAEPIVGRGGAGFPLARKLAAVANAKRLVVVVNWSEGEPGSHKDAALARVRPHLVLDGAELIAQAWRTDKIHLVLPSEQPKVVESVRAAVAERPRSERYRLHFADDRFVAGQARAVLELMGGRPNLPVTAWQPEAYSGHRNRPTLLSNAETWAQLAMHVLRPDAERSTLLTFGGESNEPEVSEARTSSRWSSVLPTEWLDDPAKPVLLGGYHGQWTTVGRLASLPVEHSAMRAAGIPLGAGVVLDLPHGECPMTMTARITNYLAEQSAGRCGPCFNGLPALAAAMSALAAGDRHQRARVEELCGLVVGRGACAHPDGTARLVRSLLTVFPVEVAGHALGQCRTELTDEGKVGVA